MIARTEQPDGSFKNEDRTPQCGKDFCDTCGDCLHCYEGDPCFTGRDRGKHIWLIYLLEKDQTLNEG